MKKKKQQHNFYEFIVFRMEFDKTKWCCPWNSDQNCAQNSARGDRGQGGGDPGDGGGPGMVGV